MDARTPHPSSRPAFGMERTARLYFQKYRVGAAALSKRARGLKCGRVRCGPAPAYALASEICVCDDINVFEWTCGRINFEGAAMSASTSVEDQVAQIKRDMPETYKAILAKAEVMGRPAYALVRRGLRGEANCFYAFERGRVVGTPFNLTEVARDVAQYMVTFGCAYVCIFAAPNELTGGAADGTH